MNAIEIKPGIYWVGAVDWAVRDFHGYTTPRGSTYNNYLVMDDDITLVDGVHHNFYEQSIANLKSLTDLTKIRNVIVNHIEPDHAGALEALLSTIGSPAI